MSEPRVAVVVQARMGSARLPGKVLGPLAGSPALVRMMERVARVAGIHTRVVATSTRASDDPIAETCARHQLHCARGPLQDVLGRFLLATPPECDTVVRLTGDCPLVDPGLVERHLKIFLEHRPDLEYVSNTVERTMPDGLDVEVMARCLLEEAGRRADSSHDREHVTPWVQRNARSHAVTQPVDLSALRWTLDTERDREVLAAIYRELYPLRPEFTTDDVYRLLLRRPELIHIDAFRETSPPERAVYRERIEQHLDTLQAVAP